jgi:hypothetical protein
LCTSTPITIIQIAPSTVGGDRRADGPHSRQLPSSYQVTLGGLGSAAATQRWQVSPRATCGNRVSRRRSESQLRTGRHRHPRMTVSSGMTPELVSLLLVHGAGSGPWAFDRWSCAPCGVTVDARSSMHPRQRSRPHPPASQCQPRARPCHASRGPRLARTPPGPP